MTRTPVVELDGEVLQRLAAYARQFARDFRRVERTHRAGIYLQGLLLDGERKRIEPLSRRVVVPGWQGNTEQALPQFVNQSPWDPTPVLQRYRRRLAAAFADPAGVLLVDDTSFLKKGTQSVGMARQYCGAVGKRENCQVAVSLHDAAPGGDYSLALRLERPEG
jgi:SRSO17 transposase